MRGPTRQAERRMATCLRYTINTHLEDQGVITPTAIGAATGLPAVEAIDRLTHRQWYAGDVATRQAVAGRLEREVVLPDIEHLRRKARAWRVARRRRGHRRTPPSHAEALVPAGIARSGGAPCAGPQAP